MAWRGWLWRLLDRGEAPERDLDEYVEVAVVSSYDAPLVVVALDDAGVSALPIVRSWWGARGLGNAGVLAVPVVKRWGGYIWKVGAPSTSIYVRRRDIEVAEHVLAAREDMNPRRSLGPGRPLAPPLKWRRRGGLPPR